MDRQQLNEKLQVLQEELYATHHILQDNIDLRRRVDMDRESFPDAEIFMQDIGKSIMDATEIRDILINEIEVVEDEIFRETKIVTMQEFLAIHELDVDFSEATKFCTSNSAKKKTQQRIGRQVSFNLLTSQVLGYNEPCQWKQINSTHMGPVHCVNRKRKKKRTSQGLSRIELQHVKMKNLQHSFNLMRMLIKYII